MSSFNLWVGVFYVTFLIENLIYWLTGSIAWIPWIFSRWLGIVTMLVFVPFTMVIATLYSLHKIPIGSWKKEI